MDNRKLNKVKRVRASTLIEVIIAMVTIVVVFGITMMICSNVVHSSVSLKKVRAQAVLNDIMEKLTASPSHLQDDNYLIGDLHIAQKVKAYHDETELNEVDLSVYDNNQQLLATLKQVIIAK
jgi:Tfp pilus assembly protein PilV